jgi:2-polyprenyl-3-methyl-5-hydroxy-6-metoxy-1,4-benzoquinol methylase/glycosyltransferase involved in cell wall biosynthesis
VASPTIGLAIIARNAEKTLAACLDSIKDHVDQIVIVLGGPSDDATEEIARRYTDEVYPFEWCDDFSAARNFSFAKLRTDWAMWLDADDVFVGGERLRAVVNECAERGYGCVQLRYDYRHDARGNVIVTQNRERLMKLSLGWTWRNRVHEYAGAAQEHLVATNDEVYVRHTSNEPNSAYYFHLLQLMEAEMTPDHPEWPRLLACFMDHYRAAGDHRKAIEYGERAFEVLTDDGMRWTTACEVSRAYQGLEDWPMSVHWAHVALSIHPEYALPYLLLAHAAWFGSQDSARALLYLEFADRRLEAPLTVFRMPEDYTTTRWSVEHRALAAEGRWAEALEVVRQAEQYLGLPGDGRPRTWNGWDYWAWYYLERLRTEHSVAGATALVDHLFRRGDTLRALRLLENDLPLPARSDPRIVALLERVRRLTAHVRGDGKAYQEFYESAHTSLTDLDKMMNAVAYEPYRMDVLVERLRKRGAKRVLDVGCGAGEPAIYLAKQGFEVVGLDINRKAIQEARRRARRAAKGNGVRPHQLEFRVGSFDTVGPEHLGQFDAVVMMELIEHLNPSDVPLYLSTAEDFLRPGGAVFITTPGMAVGDIPGVFEEFPRDHVQEFSRADLEALVLASPSRRLKVPIQLHKIYDPNAPVPGFASWFVEYEWYDRLPGENWEKPVAIYVGPGLEEWDPATPETRGIGGSETWAAKVARELRAKGHPVVVYAACDGVWDGVIYRSAKWFNPKAPFAGARAWLCIVSRYLEALDERPAADHVLFVAHDTDYGDRLSKERLENMDAYCVLSEWQWQHTLDTYAARPKAFRERLLAKLRVVQNGIEPDYFQGQEERRSHSFIWSSSPDRGLDVLLDWWPRIREMWPDATLDVYYGFQNMQALARERPHLPPFIADVRQRLRQEGVTMRGRIGQKELAREMMRHQFWLYPATDAFGQPWHETFCITALEAAAGGCIGVFPAVGALSERPGYRVGTRQMSAEDALGALRALDGSRPPPFEAQEWSWAKAAESLLAAVPQEAPALEQVSA